MIDLRRVCVISVGVFLVLIASVTGGCSPAETNPVSPESDTSEEVGVGDSDEPVEQIVMTPEDFLKRHNENDVDDLRGKTIVFEGYLTYIDKSYPGSAIFIGSEPKFTNGTKFYTKECEIWSRALPFQKIKTHASLEELQSGHVRLIWVDDGRINATANELTNAFQDDAEAAAKKYSGKFIEVSGKILSISDDKSEVELEGDGGTVVKCFTASVDGAQVGKRCRIIGECGERIYDNSLSLNQCRTISEASN